MQDRFFNLFDEVEIPVLYGLSALGSRLCVYTFTKSTNKLEPTLIINTGNRLMDVAPAQRWDIDIMSKEGQQDLGIL